MNIETVKLLAHYNSGVNSAMNKIISTLSPEEWDQTIGGYFKSMHGLCSHLFIGDQNWLNRFKNIKAFSYFNNSIFDKVYNFSEIPFTTIAEYQEKREILDTAFMKLAEEVVNEDLSKILQYKNMRGVEQNRVFGGVILHVFNHQTHHRGMISLYLEMLGRENDFSNLVSYV